MTSVVYLMVNKRSTKSECLVSPSLLADAYLSSFWKVWSPRRRSRKRKRGGSGGTSLSCCSILRVEMSKMTPLRSARDATAGEALRRWGGEKTMVKGDNVRGKGAAGEGRSNEERVE